MYTTHIPVKSLIAQLASQQQMETLVKDSNSLAIHQREVKRKPEATTKKYGKAIIPKTKECTSYNAEKEETPIC